MRAIVRFATGETASCAITNIENDGSGDYGYVRYQGRKIPVSQSTTIRRANGTIEKQWDEIVGAPAIAVAEEEW